MTRNSPQPTQPLEVQREIGDVVVTLRSDLPEVVDDFCRIYPPVRAQPDSTHPPILLEVMRSGRSRLGRKLYRVYADGCEIGGWRPASGIFPFLEWGINLRIMATRLEYLQLHAASMAYRGRGFIFPGDSGSGKSTLAATLLASGWRYFCDEFALVDVDKVSLHPFRKAICIKSGSFSRVRELGFSFARQRDYVKAYKGPVGYLDPRNLGGNETPEPTNVGFIIFPTYRGDECPKLEEVKRSDAVLGLVRCCFNRQMFASGGIPALAKIVRRSRCFRLTVGAPEATTALLEKLVDDEFPGEFADPETQPLLARAAATRRHIEHRHTTRRQMLRASAKLAYAGPTFLALSAKEAMAAGSNPSGVCSTALATGELCETDADCCSSDCDLGICN